MRLKQTYLCAMLHTFWVLTLITLSTLCASPFRVEGRHALAENGAIILGWPGNAIEGRFSGDSLTFLMNDGLHEYNVWIDGELKPILRTTHSQTRYVIGVDLGEGEHDFRLERRTEGGKSTFVGAQLAEGGKWLPAPTPKKWRIEFLGDSYTVGYGLESGTGTCNQNRIRSTTNHRLAFPSLVARYYGADLHTVAVSGTGLLRNYAGKQPSLTYPKYWRRAITGLAQPEWSLHIWKPKIVVIGLGINDFSTAIGRQELWNPLTFSEEWKLAYHAFIDELRQAYGGVVFILGAVPFGKGEQLRLVQEIVDEQKSAGYTNVYFAGYPRPLGDGCQQHPGLRDHERFAETLTTLIDSLSLWKKPPDRYIGPVTTPTSSLTSPRYPFE